MLEDFAPAKVNLTLSVLGRRPDGYHELDSLVVFASHGDRVTLTPGSDLEVVSVGAFATAITDDNLIAKAARLARAGNPKLRLGRFTLDKQLPVAAGLGGGSSDAAAALRLLMRANPEQGASVDWAAIARACGADVPICQIGKVARMQGLGERVTPFDRLPQLGCLLVNPRQPLATAAVFRALAAPTFSSAAEAAFPQRFTSIDDLVDFVRGGRNDLEPPAVALCPVIGAVKSAIAAQPDCLIARMSGSGPTCFGLFPTKDEAQRAAHAIGHSHPDWWVAACDLLP